MSPTPLMMAGAVLFLALIGLGVWLLASKTRWLRGGKSTVQVHSIPEAQLKAAAATSKPLAPGTARIRETSVKPWAARIIDLKDASVTIGRSLENTVVLPEDPVSAEHCRIQPEAGAFRLVDLGSTNRTWVNGQKIKEVLLRNGDEIRVGTTTFVFESGPAES